MAKAISNEIRKQALELFKKGIRSHSVARTLGISKTLVENWQSAFDRGDYSWTTYAWRKNSEAIALTAVSLYTELNLNIESAILCRGRSERVTAP